MPPAIRDWAAKYIWWQTPGETALRPHRVMAQVMDLGTFADVRDPEKAAGLVALADVIRHAGSPLRVKKFPPRFAILPGSDACIVSSGGHTAGIELLTSSSSAV